MAENKYVVPQIPGFDPRGARVLQDFADRLNFLSIELDTFQKSIEPRLASKLQKRTVVPGIITFPYLNGDGLIRIDDNGLVTSYMTPGSPASYQSLLYTDVSNRPNSVATETLIATVPIRAGTLRKSGDFLEYVGEYDLASLGVTKTIRYKFDGLDINANPWNNTLASTQIVEIGRIYRVTSTTVRSYIASSLPFVGQPNPFTQFGDITVSNMDSESIDFTVTIQGTNTNDITQRLGHLFSYVRSNT
jgi:hypothetical protein